ncbi:DNA-binding CsgD family transcriptional regulator [Acinetobacter baylyi]|uniref:DNA-binding CsgD family transcriptional regulator n=1 Tax=Acinetobacter baylyi TaxID=202950 RepID=A0ABU0UTP4_ACIBI|nr:helix-turn-helix transcriptional regulator [Acinetobacter baylyi]MDQ1207920.1 DNA-binding CsgD family transcriptional regulator [Acinetobacter baylyi]MDR6105004.1 DNA-binding CsgD family transcriptional regulator [Acinetobacter baylyi]MDR6184788.1 DNA-binding CsgD family transcriptional regulator [Acinetobacter baylyi]
MGLVKPNTVTAILDKVQHIDDWVMFLEHLNHTFNIQLSQLLAVDLEVQALSFSVHHGLNIEANYLNQVALTNVRLEIDDDPRLRKSISEPFQGWMHDSQHFTEQEINQTQVYQQVLQPLNIQFGSAIQLIYDNKICVILALLTSPHRGALSSLELQPIYDMLPMLQQKIYQHRHHFEYSTRTLLGSQLIQKIKQPIAIINLNGTVLELNDDAKNLCENNPHLYLHQRRFTFTANHQIQFTQHLFELERNYNYYQTLDYTQRTKTMVLDHDLFLTLDLLIPEKAHKIFGLRPVVLATFTCLKHKTQYPRELYTQIFMFTNVEHKICEQLLNAKTLKEISYTFNIQLDTVRKHLQSIFAKTKTHRQSELVQLLMKFV